MVKSVHAKYLQKSKHKYSKLDKQSKKAPRFTQGADSSGSRMSNAGFLERSQEAYTVSAIPASLQVSPFEISPFYMTPSLFAIRCSLSTSICVASDVLNSLPSSTNCPSPLYRRRNGVCELKSDDRGELMETLVFYMQRINIKAYDLI